MQHIAAQQMPEELAWELVLINNASADGTVAAALVQWQLLGEPVPIRIIDEPKRGTDHARRAGVFAARYSVILFCDDDNWLSPDYIKIGWYFLQNNSKIGLLGGQSEAVAEFQLPEWFHSMSPYYAACAPAPQSRHFNWEGMWSAGMFGRTIILLQVFDPDVPFLNQGRVGNNTGCGEDAEICMRSCLTGFDTFYLDQLHFKHFLSSHRLNKPYAEALMASVQNASKMKAVYQRALQIQRMKPYVKKVFYARQILKIIWPLRLFIKVNDGTMINDMLFFISRKQRYARAESVAVLKYVMKLEAALT